MLYYILWRDVRISRIPKAELIAVFPPINVNIIKQFSKKELRVLKTLKTEAANTFLDLFVSFTPPVSMRILLVPRPRLFDKLWKCLGG